MCDRDPVLREIDNRRLHTAASQVGTTQRANAVETRTLPQAGYAPTPYTYSSIFTYCTPFNPLRT